MKYSRAVIICLGASLSFLSKSKYASQLSLKACCLSPVGSEEEWCWPAREAQAAAHYATAPAFLLKNPRVRRGNWLPSR